MAERHGPAAGTRATILALMEVDREDLEDNDMPPPERWTTDDLFRADQLGLIYAIDLSVPVTDEMIERGARALCRPNGLWSDQARATHRLRAEAVLRAVLEGGSDAR